MSMQHAQYVLLFLVRFNNSERFQILHTLTQATHSYVLLLLNHDHRSLNFVFAT